MLSLGFAVLVMVAVAVCFSPAWHAQAMHTVFNLLFTLIFIILLAFALEFLERYYVNYVRVSSVLLNMSEFEDQWAQAAADYASTTSTTTFTTTAAPSCALEDCFAGCVLRVACCSLDRSIDARTRRSLIHRGLSGRCWWGYCCY